MTRAKTSLRRRAASTAAVVGVLGSCLFSTPPAAAVTPTDRFAVYQWGLDNILASDVWASTTGAGVSVAVVDSGVDLQHADLQCPGKLVVTADSDVVVDGGGPDDVRGSGTHAAGIIGACTNNGIGIAGIAPNASILPFQVMRSTGGASFADIATGVRRAADAGAHVIHLSLTPSIGALSYVPDLFADLEAAVEYAASRGAIVVAPAGNDTMPLCETPALFEHVVCVGATDRRDLKAWYSTFAAKTDTTNQLAVSAPGGMEHVLCGNYTESVLSLWPPELDTCEDGNAGYLDRNGTNVAAAHVSGLAALLYQRAGPRTPAARTQVLERLLWTADDLGTPGQDPAFGFGRINAVRALAADEPPVFIDVDAHYVTGMYANGFECAARATGGLAAWTEVSECYVDVMDDRVETSPVRRQGNAATAVMPVPGFGFGLYSPCWKVTVAFMGGRTTTVSGCGTQYALAVDADGIGAAGIYATGFTCAARAHGQSALHTAIEECWTIDDSDQRRDAPPVTAPGNAAATVGAFTWLGGGLREVCWRASAEFLGGARLQTTGCGWNWSTR